MFGNKQQHAENMDVKKIVFLSSYSVPTVLYTEVLKRNIQYFSRMGIWVHALLHVNSVSLTIFYV